MKGLAVRTAIVCVGVMVMLGAAVSAISSGPGGRLYQAGRYDVSSVPHIRLGSLIVGTDWNVDWTLFWALHGTIMDNAATVNTGKRPGGCSPEIETFAGTGYGTLIFGAYYNRDPLPTNPAANTMDVLRVTPNASGYDCAVLGNGKAYVNSSTPFTEGGVFAMPDPKGGFLGGAGNFLVGAYRDPYYRVYAVSDTVPDGDVTDDVADYVNTCPDRIAYSGAKDWEILGSRAYLAADYSYLEAGTDGIFYYQRNVDCSITRHAFYYDRAGDAYAPGKTGGTLIINSPGGLAVGMVNGHHAAWHTAYESAYKMALFIDLNDDGDALDNVEVSPGKFVNEYRTIYDVSSVAGSWNDPRGGEFWSDLELVTNDEGTMFLLIQDTYNLDNRGKAILVMELADNGEYVGGADGMKMILWEKGAGDGSRGFGYNVATGWYMIADASNHGNNEMEFDFLVAAIPEPGTLLLLGTGAMGAFGVLRRRRMR